MIALDCSDARLQVESIHRPLTPSPAVKAADSGSPLHLDLCQNAGQKVTDSGILLHLDLSLSK